MPKKTGTAGPGKEKSRAKRGPNGIVHWRKTRERQQTTTRERIAEAIDGMTDFPSISAIVEAGGGAFSLSSLRRNLPMVDAAQREFNAAREAQCLDRVRTRIDGGRTPRQDRLLEEERERSVDLARQLDQAKARNSRLDRKIERLEFKVASLEKGEGDRRSRRSHWNRKPDASKEDARKACGKKVGTRTA